MQPFQMHNPLLKFKSKLVVLVILCGPIQMGALFKTITPKQKNCRKPLRLQYR